MPPAGTEDVWQILSLFQSTDIVRRWFKERHNRSLNLERATEIAACFLQGDQYFKSSQQAADVVKPLLLYYGILSLTRGIILFLDPRKKEESLSPSHGLSQHEWRRAWSIGATGFLSLTVSINHGTFEDLQTATGNKLTNSVGFFNQVLRREKVLSLGTSDNGMIGMSDLISRIEELANIYAECSGSDPNVMPCVVGTQGTQYHVTVRHPDALHERFQLMLRQRFKIPDSAGIRPVLGQAPTAGFSIPFGEYDSGLPNVPHIENRSSSGHCIIAPWPNGGYLSPLLRYFLISYMLGMIVRYYPSKWMNVLFGRQKGDAILPLARAAMTLVEVGFPTEAVRALNS